MNIIILACADFPVGDATSSRVKLLARTMIEAGNQVSLAILHPNSKSVIRENNLISGCIEGIRFKYLNGSTVRPSGIIEAIKDTARGGLGSFSYIMEKIRKKEADLIIFYTPDIFLILPTLIISKILRIPTILELCELNSSGQVQEGLVFRIKMCGAKVTDRILPVISGGVIAISTGIIDHVKRLGLGGKKIIHIPVLVEFLKLSKNSVQAIPKLNNRRYFLHSGTLMEKDGVEFLVKAFDLVARLEEEVFLVFTGKHSKEKQLEITSFADDAIKSRILFIGFLEEDELIWAYQNAEALLCCRSNSRYAHFGFPTKIAEYLASGRPVITNEVGDVNLYLKHLETAYISETENPQSIAEAMKLVLNDPGTATLIGIKGQEVARAKFYYKNYVQELKDFTKACVANTN